MTVEEMKNLTHEVVKNYWNKKEFDLAGKYYSPDYVNHSPLLPDVQNLDQFKQWCISFKNGFPDFKVTIEEIVVEGDMTATRWTLHCTHTGEYMGFPPSGKKVEMSGMTMDRLKDGKIVEAWWNNDDFGMMQQLGIIPPME
jgi:steroid delta-isomerase-like uncharacterized protein